MQLSGCVSSRFEKIASTMKKVSPAKGRRIILMGDNRDSSSDSAIWVVSDAIYRQGVMIWWNSMSSSESVSTID